MNELPPGFEIIPDDDASALPPGFEIIPDAADRSALQSLVTDPIMRGVNEGQASVYGLGRGLGVISNETAAAGITRNKADAQTYPVQPSVEAGMRDIQSQDTWLGAAGAVARNPRAVLDTAVSSLPVSMVAPTAALFGGIGGAAAPEYAATITDEIVAVTGKQPTPEALAAAMRDPAIMAAAQQKAALRGAIVGFFDAASMGVGGRVLGPVSRGLGAGRVGNVAGTVAELGVQGGMGAAGEAGGQLATEGRISSPGEVLMEGAAEIPGSIPEIVGGVVGQRQKPAEPAQPAMQDGEPWRPTIRMSPGSSRIPEPRLVPNPITGDPNDPVDLNGPELSEGDLLSPIKNLTIQKGKEAMDRLIGAGPQPAGAPPAGFEPLYSDENESEQIGWINPRTNEIRKLDEAAAPEAQGVEGEAAAPVEPSIRMQPGSTRIPDPRAPAPVEAPGRLIDPETEIDTRPRVQPQRGEVVKVKRDDGREVSGTVAGVRPDGKVEVTGDLGGKVSVSPDAIVKPEPAPAPAPIEAPAPTPAPVAQGGINAPAPKATTFTTAKGSTYVIHEDGTTSRNKAARNDPGHEGDSGQKPRSARTVYLDTNAAELSAAGLSLARPDKGARVVFDGQGRAALLTWNEKANRWGKSSEWLPTTSEPGVGRYPLELWNKTDDVPGFEAYGRMHAGNPITAMGTEPAVEAAPVTTPAKPAPKGEIVERYPTVEGVELFVVKNPEGKFNVVQRDADADEVISVRVGYDTIEKARDYARELGKSSPEVQAAIPAAPAAEAPAPKPDILTPVSKRGKAAEAVKRWRERADRLLEESRPAPGTAVGSTGERAAQEAEAITSVLRNFRDLPAADAAAKAKREIREVIARHNARRKGDVNWAVAEGAYDGVIDAVAADLANLKVDRPAPAPEPKEPKPAEQAAPEGDDRRLIRTLRDIFRSDLIRGDKFNILKARKVAADVIGSDKIRSDDSIAKVTEEVFESAVVQAAREIVVAARRQTTGIPDREAFDQLVDLYSRQPLLSTRTSTSVEQQAYSTPAPLAFLASKLAGITPETTVYEPTAGNGMLLIDANRAKTYANELNPDRIKNLAEVLGPAAKITRGDGTTAKPPVQVDRVIANPPFGKVKVDGKNKTWDIDGFRSPEIDHAISWQALSAMKDDGRAVLIIGGKQGTDAERVLKYRADDTRAFFKKLYDAYNVVDHFTVDGKLYERQGASWPVDVIVIDGRGKSSRDMPMKTAPTLYTSWDQLKGKLDDRVDTAGQRPRAGERPAPAPAAQGSDAAGVPLGAGGEDRPAGGQGAQGAGAGTPASAGAGGKPVRQGRPKGGRPAAGGEQRPAGARAPDNANPPVADTGRPGDAGVSGGGDAGVVPGEPVPGGDELDGLIDSALDDIFGEKPKPVAAPAAAKAPRTPGEIAKSAVKNTVMGMDEVASGLTALFGGNKVSSGLTFDEKTYAKAKPYFLAGIKNLKAAGSDIAELVRALVGTLANQYKMAREAIEAMKPYLKRFIADVQAGKVSLAETVEEDAKPAAEEKPAPARRENKEAETNFQVRYEPTSGARYAVGTLVPRNMQTAMSKALADLRERVGDIDQFVADKLDYKLGEVTGTETKPGYFSAEQVDALALAIDNVERGGGFIIGDQTGVGKGRFVAAMLRYALNNGRAPVFVTKQPGLYADMIRDLRDIGMLDIASRIFVTDKGLRGEKQIPLSDDVTDVLTSATDGQNKKAMNYMMENGNLPEGVDMLFTTYSQMQYGGDGKVYDRQRALQAIAPNAMFVLDESHEAGGTASKQFTKDGEEIPTRADFVRALLREANGVIYSSATYAKNPTVMSLYFKTDLSQAVEDISTLGAVIESGGVPLQQVIANMLVEGGQYARRERSYEGVEIQMDVLPSDEAMAKGASKALRDIFLIDTEYMDGVRKGFIEKMEEEGEKGGRDNAVGEEASETGFANVMHNVVAQMLLSIKAPAVVDKAIALHKAGEKPIVALSNTNETILKDFIDEENLKPGDAANLTFNVILERYLRRLRRITLKDANKNIRHLYLTDAQIEQYGGPDALARYKEVERAVRKLDLGALPASPVDYIIDRLNAAGIDTGEITGRQLTLTNGIITQRKASAAEKKRAMNAYNSGAIDALVINKSGSTGFSLHATGQKGNDGKPRHMIVLQPDANIDVFMQMLGRIHRTGQIKLPRYTLAVSDLAVEKRAAAVLMRKMASLNANTTASKRSAVSLDAVDFMNKYGDEVVADWLRENTEIANLTDVRPGDGNNDGLSARFTGRLAIIDPADVVKIYEQIEAAYTDYIDSLDRMGLNSLEAKTLELDARTISTDELVAEKGGDGPFAAAANVETVDVKVLGKPMSWDEVQEAVGERKSEGTSRRDVERFLEAKMPGFMKTIEDGIARADKMAEEAKTEKQKAKAEKSKKGWETQKEEARMRLDDIKRHAERLRAGQVFNLTVTEQVEDDEGGTESTTRTIPAVSLGVDFSKLGDNPTAASAIMVRFAIADPARELKIPLSKLLGEKPRYLAVEAYSRDEIREAFENGQTSARETRQIITGNLVSGFAAFKKGQIIMFTDDKGNRRQGIMMPRAFNASDELAKMPVTFASGEQIKAFLEGGDNRLVLSSDRTVSITKKPFAPFALSVNTKGAKPYILNKSIRSLVGDFIQRKGAKVYTKNLRPEDVAKVVAIYQDEVGAKFITTGHKAEARELVDQTPAKPTVANAMRERGEAKVSARERREVEAIVRRIAGPGVKLRLDEPIPTDPDAARASGGTANTVASGSYNFADRTMHIAMGLGENTYRSAAHEAFHDLQGTGLFTEAEEVLMEAETERMRAEVQKAYPFLRADQMPDYEVQAYAFELYEADRRAGKLSTWLKAPIRTAFDRLYRIIRAVRAYLAGRGFKTYEDVFEAAARGDVAKRAARKEPRFDGTAFSMREREDETNSLMGDFGNARRGIAESLVRTNGNLLAKVRAATSWDAISESVDSWRAAMQDIVIDLKQVQREIVSVLGRELGERENPYLAYELNEGRAGARLDRLQDEHMVPLLDALKSSKVSERELNDYLYARHAPERNAQIARINPNLQEAGSGMSDEEAAEIMDRFKREGKTAELARLAGMVDRINQFAMNTRLEAGLLSEEQASTWADTYRHYVPLRGFEDMDPELADERPSLGGTGTSVRGQESRRALGRESRASDILAHVVMQAQEAIVRAERNRVARALYELVQTAPNAEFWKADKVERKAVFNKKTGQVEYRRVTALSQVEEQHTVYLKIDGVQHRVTFVLSNPRAKRLAEGMRRLKGKDWGIVVSTLGAVNRFLSKVNTSYNPAFVIVNAFRDAITATVNLQQFSDKMPGITRGTLGDYRKALAASTKGAYSLENDSEWGRWYREFLDAGGKTSWNSVEDVRAIQKKIEAAMQTKGKLGPVVLLKRLDRFVQNGNDGVENAIRLSAYKNARTRGMTPAQAASLAKNLTVNFNRRGAYGPLMNSLFLFYNASVQGSATLLAAMKNPRVRKMVYGIALTGTVVTLLNAMFGDTDDDGEPYYDKIPDFDKQRNIILMLPGTGGKYIKIPMPYGYSAMYGFGRTLTEVAFGRDATDALADATTGAFDSFNPVGGGSDPFKMALPTLFRYGYELKTNEDYAGRPITPDSKFDPNVPMAQRYWNSVSPASKGVTDVMTWATGGDKVRPGGMDVSPEHVDYAISAVFGAAGAFYYKSANSALKLFDPTSDMTVDDIPLANKVYGGKRSFVDKAALYERTAEIEREKGYVKKYAKEGDAEQAKALAEEKRDVLSMDKAATATRETLSAIRKARNATYRAYDDDKITKEERTTRLKALKEREDAAVMKFNTLWNQRVEGLASP